MAYIPNDKLIKNKIKDSMFWTATQDITVEDGVVEKGTTYFYNQLEICCYEKETGEFLLFFGRAEIRTSVDDFEKYIKPNNVLNEAYHRLQLKLEKKQKNIKYLFPASMTFWAVMVILYIINCFIELSVTMPLTITLEILAAILTAAIVNNIIVELQIQKELSYIKSKPEEFAYNCIKGK